MMLVSIPSGGVAVWAILLISITTSTIVFDNSKVLFVSSFCPSTSSSLVIRTKSSRDVILNPFWIMRTHLHYGYNMPEHAGSFPDMDSTSRQSSKKQNDEAITKSTSTSRSMTTTSSSTSSYNDYDNTEVYDISSSSSSSSSYVSQITNNNNNNNNNNSNNPRRRWNLNRGTESPFGMSLNAEVWNGRIAQISFVWIFLQELIFGKGILQSIADHDAAGSIALVLFTVSVLVVSGRFLAEIPGTAMNKQRTNPYPTLPSVRDIVNPMIAENSFWGLFNYNNGESPYGFRTNAEIWNGRLAQLSFVWIIFQEYVQGKPILQSIAQGDVFGLLSLLFFTFTVTTTASFIKLTEDDDYVERVVGRPALEANAEIFRNTKQFNVPYTSPAALRLKQEQYNANELQPEQTFSVRESKQSVPSTIQLSWEDAFAASLKAMTSGNSGSSSSRNNTNNNIPSNNQNPPSPAPTSSSGSVVSYVDSVRVNGDDYYSSLPTDSKIHPDADFKFKTVTRKLIQSFRQQQKNPKPKKEPVMPISPATAYPVEGFSFKADVKNMVKPIRSTSPHPEGTFRFSDPYLTRSTSTVTSGSSSSLITTPPPSAKVYPVPGFSFKSEVKSMVKQDDTPHPGGTFRFQDKTRVITNANQQQSSSSTTAVTVYPVPGFSFKSDVKALIHPDGKFRFQDSTLNAAFDSSDSATMTSTMKVTSPKVLSPPAQVYPVPGFSFKSDVKSLVKKTADPSLSSSSSDPNTSGTKKATTTTEARANVNAWPVQGFKFSETTQSLSKESTTFVSSQGSTATDNTVVNGYESTVTTPLSSPVQDASPIRTSSFAGSSYLEALSSGGSWSPATDFEDISNNSRNSNDSTSSSYYDSSTPPTPTPPEPINGSSSPARWNSPGGSYLDSLNSKTQ